MTDTEMLQWISGKHEAIHVPGGADSLKEQCKYSCTANASGGMANIQTTFRLVLFTLASAMHRLFTGMC